MGLVAHCPAKVNLVLRVLGRRPDGFHEIDTVFQAVDLWDVLEARPDSGLRIECDDPTLPADERNLVIRAATVLREHLGVRDGASFRLGKSIPAGAGLGGGSSDAAGALALCARLWRVAPGDVALDRLAGRVGADVAFFLKGGTARGRGRGDRVEALPFVGDIPVLLGSPPFGISTAEVYRRVAGRAGPPAPGRLTPLTNDVSVARLSTLKLPGGNDFGVAVNDLEEVVLEGWPELKTFRDALRAAGATNALVSGSGSTVFGTFADPEAVSRAADGLRREFPAWSLRSSRTIRGGVRVVSGEGDPRH